MTLPRFSLGTLRQGKLTEKLNKRANMILREALTLHRESPRSGVNRNKFGEMRSAPGEPPAPETRRLLRLMVTEQPSFLERDITVNYAIMESGYVAGKRARISDHRSFKRTVMRARPIAKPALIFVRSIIRVGG